MSTSTCSGGGQRPNCEWPAIDKLFPLNEASLIFGFHGLMCLAFNRNTGLLETGIHSRATDHNFGIFVFGFGRNLADPILIYSFEPDSHDDVPGGLVTVEVSTPRDPGVQFYLPKKEDTFTWAQVIDLEGPEFYKCKLKKKKGVLKPKITINHGRFFVLPTPNRFRRIEESATPGEEAAEDIGTIAYVGVGLVRHSGTGRIRIVTEREELSLPVSNERPLLVVFANACPQNECESNQNDFPQYYKTISLRSDQKKFRLEPESRRDAPDLGRPSFLTMITQQEIFATIASSTNAPCGIAGYGQSRGIADSSGT
jgi:hypothetical protein